MRVPSDAQAGLLALVAEHAERDETVEWLANAPETRTWGYRPSMAVLYTERIDRERNVGAFVPVDRGRRIRRVATVEACIKKGWLQGGERMYTSRCRTYSIERKAHVDRTETWWLRALELTEDGLIALGVWRQRKLNADPVALPALSDREREIVELAQRALDLGYALCAREPARGEARKMRKDGWFSGCWVANSVTGLVPTSLAVADVFPERADQPEAA